MFLMKHVIKAKYPPNQKEIRIKLTLHFRGPTKTHITCIGTKAKRYRFYHVQQNLTRETVRMVSETKFVTLMLQKI